MMHGLRSLHANDIIQRDLKAMNGRLNESNYAYAKLTDFGLAIVKSAATSTTSGKGTPAWMAPTEAFQHSSKCTTTSGVARYALGMVTWRCLHTICPRSAPLNFVSEAKIKKVTPSAGSFSAAAHHPASWSAWATSLAAVGQAIRERGRHSHKWLLHLIKH